MNTKLLLAAALVLSPATLVAAVVAVPGSANPWLAGMPDGSTAGNGQDFAPAQSPIQVPSGLLAAGVPLTFSATGGTSFRTDGSLTPAEGDLAAITTRDPGAENGIADLVVPLSALIGVFLDDTQPSLSVAPDRLDFSDPASRDFLSLDPVLRQPFYIGDGLTSASVVQEFYIPTGATRLYLGTMDGFGWFNNIGVLTVAIAPIPEPASALLTLPLLALTTRRLRRA